MDASSITAHAARQQARTEKTLQLVADKKVKELIKEHLWMSAHFVAYGEKMLKSGVAAQTLASIPQAAPSIAWSSGSLSSSGLAETPYDLQVGTRMRVVPSPHQQGIGLQKRRKQELPSKCIAWEGQSQTIRRHTRVSSH
eukprot:194641-Amphidinium_carterae.1